ncbi:sodium/hydrogen exchanger 8 [Anaeramoeba ignava]|uniref:Sodium/hydrogen exchanger 8 n=1 Tax=Anaeramoeba ignava TaxID=1746090 RepID=A0A9Q0RDD4_ANAIG|nr:sodium/hydrogen exchanger 8 [Anaeramoeba ignava]
MESALFFSLAWCSYMLSAALDLSGIAAILFCGIFMGHYTIHNIGERSQKITKEAIYLIAYLSEAFVFLYLGLAVFSFNESYNLPLIGFAILACLFSRALNIYPISAIVNLWRKYNKIFQSHQFMIWFSGLRGAVAFALSIRLKTEHSKSLMTTTLMVVVFTVIFLGGFTPLLVKKLKLENTVIDKFPHGQGQKDSISGEPIDREYTRPVRSNPFLRMDRKYFIPFFTKKKYHQSLRSPGFEMENLSTDKTKKNSIEKDYVKVTHRNKRINTESQDILLENEDVNDLDEEIMDQWKEIQISNSKNHNKTRNNKNSYQKIFDENDDDFDKNNDNKADNFDDDFDKNNENQIVENDSDSNQKTDKKIRNDQSLEKDEKFNKDSTDEKFNTDLDSNLDSNLEQNENINEKKEEFLNLDEKSEKDV